MANHREQRQQFLRRGTSTSLLPPSSWRTGERSAEELKVTATDEKERVSETLISGLPGRSFLVNSLARRYILFVRFRERNPSGFRLPAKPELFESQPSGTRRETTAESGSNYTATILDFFVLYKHATCWAIEGQSNTLVLRFKDFFYRLRVYGFNPAAKLMQITN